MPDKRFRRKSLTILYLKCPVCTESSHISQWMIACFDDPTYQRSALIETQSNDESLMICPKCLRSSKYGELIRMQKAVN